MPDGNDNDGLLALLAWWREAGVGDAMAEAPIDWTVRGDAGPGAGYAWPARTIAEGGATAPPAGTRAPARHSEARGAPPPPSVPARPQPQLQPAAVPAAAAHAAAPTRPAMPRREPAALAAAREAANAARTLEELAALLDTYDGCPLKATAKSLCFYRGAATARLMLIGEAPGRDEDLAGKPFVGRAGKLLDKMLGAIGMGEADVHITNTVYWRPPGNRVPTPEEALACQPFLARQMELVAPELILTLGGQAAKAVLDATDGIMRLRGRWREISVGGRSVRVMPTLHPAYLLRQPDAKRHAWRDLLMVKVALDGLGASPP